MKALIEYLEAELELKKDMEELLKFGLTEEEVEGYKEFFIENYFPPIKLITKVN